MKFCRSCGEKLDIEGKIGREGTCPNCGAYLHSCVHCKFHDEFAHNRCREPDAEWVTDKGKGNFCGLFRFKESALPSPDLERRRKAKEELKRLFGKD